MRGQQLLITGHTGFKGAWLCLLADELGATVSGVSLPAEPDSLVDIAGLAGRWPEMLADLTHPGVAASAVATFEPSVVVHLAAQPLVRAAFRDPLRTFATNVMGTAHLLDACVRSPSVRAVVVVTTDKVYGTGDHAFTEHDPLAARDPYGASKVATETAAAAWQSVADQERSPTAPLTIVTVRAGNVVGGGDAAEDRLLPDLVRSFRSGVTASVRHPEAIRPWQHVLDPLAGYLTLADAIAAGTSVPTALNFGPRTSGLTVGQVCTIAADRWGAGATWQAINDAGPPETTTLQLNSDLATATLTWQSRWTAEESVVRTVDWWRSVDAGTDPTTACGRDIADFLTR